MKLWLSRREKPELRAVMRTLGQLDVNHKVTYEPRPRPTMIVPTIYGSDGRKWVLQPIDCTHRHSAPVTFPVAYITGRPEDGGTFAEITLDLEYLRS